MNSEIVKGRITGVRMLVVDRADVPDDEQETLALIRRYDATALVSRKADGTTPTPDDIDDMVTSMLAAQLTGEIPPCQCPRCLARRGEMH